MYSKEDINSIPFKDVVLPYTKELFGFITELGLPKSNKNRLQYKFLQELSSIAEASLQLELDRFVKNKNGDFDVFLKKMKSSLAVDYPVLDKMLKKNVYNFSDYILKIVNRFQQDSQKIITTFNISSGIDNLKIIDIEANLGDGHNGESTALVYLSDGTKIIYKPRNVAITNSYNSFIDWINSKLNTDIKIFKVLECGVYGWLEFIKYEKVNSENDLKEYYNKAGMLLAVTLIIGSNDCHSENVITSGKNPVIIDHETINQPLLKKIEKDKIRPFFFSVLETNLIVTPKSNIPFYSAGYGARGNIEGTETTNINIYPNTLDSKRVPYHRNKKVIEENVPQYKEEYIFANKYRDSFNEGFSVIYDFFMNSKEELKGDSSPINFFKNNEIRFLWRPTDIYDKILKYLRKPIFMSNFKAYRLKLYELLSKAYKGEHMKEYKFILDFEIKQMLNGDIPIFNLKSSDTFLEGNTLFKIFEYNCTENIHHRISLLSDEHKKEQQEHIEQWLNL